MINPNPGRQIVLETHAGLGISNSIDVDPTPGMVALARAPYGNLFNAPGTRQLGLPTGRYNCHGLVFGSRRTNIPALGNMTRGLVDQILAQDHYVRVVEADAQEGDVVVWRSAQDVDHTGFVAYVDRALGRTIFVWSMWGGLGEFLHRIPFTPYADCVVEFWGLR